MEIIKAFLPLVAFLILWFGVGYYYSRKVEEHRNSIKEDASRPADYLTLVRGVEQVNYIRNYKVIIDSEVVGVIASGETKHFEMSPGTHTIQVKIDWCRSRPCRFESSAGENVELNCGATYNDWRCMFMFVIRPSTYVYVQSA